jgi:hypothetical protein
MYEKIRAGSKPIQRPRRREDRGLRGGIKR